MMINLLLLELMDYGNISNQECINIVKDFFLKNNIKGAGNYLYKEASKRWIMEQDIVDDISIIIIFFDN